MSDTKEKKGAVSNVKETLVNAIDQNGNGEIDIEDIILLSMKIPGIKIDRAEFLNKELTRYYPQEKIQKAIDLSPALADIKPEDLDKIAQEVIKYERVCVSGISTLLGVPGGLAMVATIPADIAQYYGYMLRAAQKLMYLYGFQQLDLSESGTGIDSETMNTLIICLGVMYGDALASKALLAMTKALAVGVEKKLLRTALTKGTFYPIVKQVAKWFGVRMNKQIFASFFKKAIPVVGGVMSGTLTYLSFAPCCNKLKDSLKDTYLSNPKCQQEIDIKLEGAEEPNE